MIMRSKMRTAAVFWLGAMTLLASAAPPLHAQGYPARPLRFLVGGPPGSGQDLVSRMLAPKLSERLGQPVVVEQRTGAGGIIASEALAKSPPDGHTLILLTGAHPTQAAMRRTLPEKIVAVVEALAEDLADWCVEGRDRTRAAHEEAVLQRVRQVLPLLLRAVVEQATSGLDVRLAHAIARSVNGGGTASGGRPRRGAHRRRRMSSCEGRTTCDDEPSWWPSSSPSCGPSYASP